MSEARGPKCLPWGQTPKDREPGEKRGHQRQPQWVRGCFSQGLVGRKQEKVQRAPEVQHSSELQTILSL